MIYSDRKDLLDLYNAVGGRHYEDPELLEISPPTVPTCPCGIYFISRICIPG